MTLLVYPGRDIFRITHFGFLCDWAIRVGVRVTECPGSMG